MLFLQFLHGDFKVTLIWIFAIVAIGQRANILGC